jgi:glycerophosphoryl diester phosphodiesterase
MSEGPNPDSFLRVGDRTVDLKVHRCLWSGRYSENSPLAIAECAAERVMRTEIDVRALRDGEFVVLHDDRFDRVTDARGFVREATAVEATRPRFEDGSHPLLFSEAIERISANEYPRRIELDLKDLAPYTRRQAEALARAAQPLKERAHFSCPADWNLRRLLVADPELSVSLNPHCYIDTEFDEDARLPIGAYGYRDAHPLARERVSSTAEYLRDRFSGIMRLVPGISEAHVRVEMFERILDDGVADVAEIFHSLGLKLDVGTLDAETPRWHERLTRIVAAGVDIVTTNTARELAAAWRASSLSARGATP